MLWKDVWWSLSVLKSLLNYCIIEMCYITLLSYVHLYYLFMKINKNVNSQKINFST